MGIFKGESSGAGKPSEADIKDSKVGSKSRRVGIKPSMLWGCGYSLIVSQWLANGSLGSSWLPEFANFGRTLVLAQILFWGSYMVFLLILGVFCYRRFTPLYKQKAVLSVGTAAIVVGDFLVYSAGGGFFDSGVYVGGMLLLGAGISTMIIGWGEFYCAIGEKRTCIILGLCFVVGSALFLLVSVIGQASIPLAITVQCLIMIMCPIMLIRARTLLGEEQHEQGASNYEEKIVDTFDRKNFPYRSLIPYLVTILIFGLILGVVTGLTSTKAMDSSPFVWAIGMGGMGTLLLVGALLVREFTLDRLSRVLIPLLAISLLLVPALMPSYFDIVIVLICSGYVYARAFYMVAYVSIAQTRTVPVLPLIAIATASDVFGVIVGQVFCGLFIHDTVPIEMIYPVAVIAISFLILTGSFSLREKNIVTLWGLKKNEMNEDLIEQRCMQVAVAHGLTLRETEVMLRLAQGLTTELIAPELELSVATVRTHIRNTYAKLDVHSQPELMRMIMFREDESDLPGNR